MILGVCGLGRMKDGDEDEVVEEHSGQGIWEIVYKFVKIIKD